MTDLQALQRRLGLSGDHAAVGAYQERYVNVFPAGGRVLDLGCGEGVFLELLRAAGRAGLGVDTSGPDLAAARERGLEVVEQDVLEFLAGRRSERFDGVFCAHLIEHFTPVDAIRLLAGARAVLRPQGRLVVITPDPRDLEVISERFWLDLTHVRPYPLALLVPLLAALGYEVLESGNDPRSAHTRVLRNLPRRALGWLRLGAHAARGDAFVIAARGSAAEDAV